MTVDITHDCIWILNADKHLRFLQSKHLQCGNSQLSFGTLSLNSFVDSQLHFLLNGVRKLILV